MLIMLNFCSEMSSIPVAMLWLLREDTGLDRELDEYHGGNVAGSGLAFAFNRLYLFR